MDKKIIALILGTALSVCITFNCYAQSANDHYGLGLQYQGQGDNQRAIAEFQKAIDIDPQSTSAYYAMGLSEEKEGNNLRAIEDFSKVIEIKPQDATAYYARGLLYYGQGNFTQAINDYSQVLQIKPNDSAALGARDIAQRSLQENPNQAVSPSATASGNVDVNDAQQQNTQTVAPPTGNVIGAVVSPGMIDAQQQQVQTVAAQMGNAILAKDVNTLEGLMYSNPSEAFSGTRKQGWELIRDYHDKKTGHELLSFNIDKIKFSEDLSEAGVIVKELFSAPDGSSHEVTEGWTFRRDNPQNQWLFTGIAFSSKDREH